MIAKIRSGQSLADFAVEHFGTWEALIDIALMNDIPMSEIPEAGIELTIPDAHFNLRMEQYCKQNSVSPATVASTASSQQRRIFTLQFTQQFM